MKKYVLVTLLFLAACATEPVTSDDIAVSTEMRASKNWTKYIDQLYNPISVCLKVHPSQPAFAGDVIPTTGERTFVHMIGKDGRVYDCVTANNGTAPEQLKISQDPSFKGPSFYPSGMTTPESTKCNWIDRVKTKKDRHLGWVVSDLCNGTGVPPEEPKVSAESVFGTDWKLQDIDGHGVVDASHATIMINAEGRVSGDAGCNLFSGTAKIRGSTLAFGPLMSTKRACVSPVRGKQEADYLGALERVRGWRTDNNLLYLTDVSGKDILRYGK